MQVLQIYPSALGFSIDYESARNLIDSVADPLGSERSEVSGLLVLVDGYWNIFGQPTFCSRFDYTLWISTFEDSVAEATAEVVKGVIWGDGMYAMLNLLRDFVLVRYQDGPEQSSKVGSVLQKMIQLVSMYPQINACDQGTRLRINLLIGLMSSALKHFEVGDLR